MRGDRSLRSYVRMDNLTTLAAAKSFARNNISHAVRDNPYPAGKRTRIKVINQIEQSKGGRPRTVLAGIKMMYRRHPPYENETSASERDRTVP